MMLFSFAGGYQCFGGTCCFLIQGRSAYSTIILKIVKIQILLFLDCDIVWTCTVHRPGESSCDMMAALLQFMGNIYYQVD